MLNVNTTKVNFAKVLTDARWQPHEHTLKGDLFAGISKETKRTKCLAPPLTARRTWHKVFISDHNSVKLKH